MKLCEHPTILDLAETPTDLLPLFTPVERAVIEVCKTIVAGNDIQGTGNEKRLR